MSFADNWCHASGYLAQGVDLVNGPHQQLITQVDKVSDYEQKSEPAIVLKLIRKQNRCQIILILNRNLMAQTRRRFKIKN